MNVSDTPSTWLLLDERASHRSQVIGVAERLGWPYLPKEIRFGQMATLANALPIPASLRLTPETRGLISPPWPDLVIAAGRRAANVALAVKHRSSGTRLVHMMWPDVSPQSFDLIVLPEHDTARREGHNLLRTLGSPHGVTPVKLTMEAARWHNHVARLPHPRIALLVGGSTRGFEYEDADFKTLAAYASAEADRLGGSLLVTSSPRTGANAEAIIKSLLTVPHVFHQWGSGDNPYTAFLGLADAIIVTGDSVSMCTEACATGKPVYIFVPPHMPKGKNAFLDVFFARTHAKPHTYAMRLDWQPAPLADAASEVAHVIQTHLFHSRAA